MTNQNNCLWENFSLVIVRRFTFLTWINKITPQISWLNTQWVILPIHRPQSNWDDFSHSMDWGGVIHPILIWHASLDGLRVIHATLMWDVFWIDCKLFTLYIHIYGHTHDIFRIRSIADRSLYLYIIHLYWMDYKLFILYKYLWCISY